LIRDFAGDEKRCGAMHTWPRCGTSRRSLPRDLVEIDVRKDEDRRVAAQLQREARHGFRRAVHQSFADRQAAREMNLRAARMPQHFLADGIGLPDN